ncbi:hypothetical protein XENORESO_020279 [Xenotaenia resolanae]|uniref:Immunoglobulin domain-containing protein n=1 Tax=Xenotaenia resolanae TaxID=208358 RepID=A0ABV0WXN5_9TELE
MLYFLAEKVCAVWSVTFENQDYCAVKGSSVEFKCSYNYPDDESVRETAWYKGMLQDGIWERVKLSVLPTYKNRFAYRGDHVHNCSLVLQDLQEDDTGYYYFWFDTNRFGRNSKRSVYLSVTGKIVLHKRFFFFMFSLFNFLLCLISRAEIQHTPQEGECRRQCDPRMWHSLPKPQNNLVQGWTYSDRTRV